MNRRNYLARPQLRDERPRRPVRSAVLVGTLALGLGVGAACGSDDPTKAAPSAEAVGNDGTISGMQRDEPLDVSAIRLPEAVDGATAGEFTTVAKPGGLLVMYFGYTNCPDVCPTTLAALRQAYKGLGDDAKRIETAMPPTSRPRRSRPAATASPRSHTPGRPTSSTSTARSWWSGPSAPLPPRCATTCRS